MSFTFSSICYCTSLLNSKLNTATMASAAKSSRCLHVVITQDIKTMVLGYLPKSLYSHQFTWNSVSCFASYCNTHIHSHTLTLTHIACWSHRPALRFCWEQKNESDSNVCQESVCGSKDFILYTLLMEGADFSETQVLIHQNAKYISERLKLLLSVKIVFVRKTFVFWDVMLRRMVAGYRRFGRTFRSHPQSCPETSVTNYQPTLRNNLEQRRPQLHRGGSL
jgi:hypothetical protein